MIPGCSTGERTEASGAAVAPGVAIPRIPAGGAAVGVVADGWGGAAAPAEEDAVSGEGVEPPVGAGVRVGAGGGVTTGQVPAGDGGGGSAPDWES